MKLFCLTFLLFFLSCRDTKIDETTTASTLKTWLPKKDSTYNIIGYQNGIRGCLIDYSEHLYRGGDILSIEGAKTLQQKGIKTVISVTPNENIITLCKSVQFEHYNLFYDYGDLSDSATIHFLKVLNRATPPLYIHCFSGKQRAGLLCAIIRIYEGWDFEKALDEYEKLGGKVMEDTPLLQQAHTLIKLKKTTQSSALLPLIDLP